MLIPVFVLNHWVLFYHIIAMLHNAMLQIFIAIWGPPLGLKWTVCVSSWHVSSLTQLHLCRDDDTKPQRKENSAGRRLQLCSHQMNYSIYTLFIIILFFTPNGCLFIAFICCWHSSLNVMLMSCNWKTVSGPSSDSYRSICLCAFWIWCGDISSYELLTLYVTEIRRGKVRESRRKKSADHQ